MCVCECEKRRASCLFIRNIRWEMRGAWEKSKKQGICLFHFLKSMRVGDLMLLQDIDCHECGQNQPALLILLRIFYFLMIFLVWNWKVWRRDEGWMEVHIWRKSAEEEKLKKESQGRGKLWHRYMKKIDSGRRNNSGFICRGWKWSAGWGEIASVQVRTDPVYCYLQHVDDRDVPLSSPTVCAQAVNIRGKMHILRHRCIMGVREGVTRDLKLFLRLYICVSLLALCINL